MSSPILAVFVLCSAVWAGTASADPAAPRTAVAAICDGDDCCPDGTKRKLGSAANDVLLGSVGSDCLLGFGGGDLLLGSFGGDHLFCGAGRDIGLGGPGPDVMWGRAGRDTLLGGPGNDVIVPGSGADLVDAGAGDDEVIVYDPCELERGEILQGGDGRDTLTTPLPIERLRALGVRVHGFEQVRVDRGSRCKADCSLPCSRVLPGFAALPDPTHWSVDRATGARFRRATRAELRLNRWDPGTFLVEGQPLMKAATAGAAKATVLVPLSDQRARKVEMDLRQRTAGLTFIERRFTPRGLEAKSKRPVLFEYVTAGLDLRRPRPVRGAWLGLLSGDDGGVYGYGLLDGMEVAVDAPNPGWFVDALTAPGGGAVAPASLVKVSLLSIGPFGTAQFSQCSSDVVFTCEWLCAEIPGLPCDDNPHLDPVVHHCHDDVSNDDDNHIDTGDEDCVHHPDPFNGNEELENATWGCDQHPGLHVHRWESGKSFALFGEGRFCTQYGGGLEDGPGEGNWIQRLTRVGWDAEAFLGQVGQVAFGGGEGQMRYVAGGCWVFSSPDAADACADNENDCDVADAGAYPYAGQGDSAAGHYNRVWQDVEHAMFHGLDDPLHLAQVVFFGGSDGQPHPLACSAEEGTGCCGAALVGNPPPDFSDLSADQRGASVIQYGNCSAPHLTSSHEFGHSLGLDHDNTAGPCGAAPNCIGFMNDVGGPGPVLEPFNQGQFDGCLLAWDCPRPSGFRFTP